MDYKEKYNAALERAKEVLLTSTTYQMFVIQEIFPELAESEDKKIGLEIRNFIWNYPEKLPERDRWLAWFEKQKDYIKLSSSAYTSNRDINEFADNYSHTIWENLMDNFNKIENYSIGCNDVSDLVLNAIIHTYYWLEKQGQTFTKKDVDNAYLKGVYDTKHEIEKQGESTEIPFGAKDSELQEVSYDIPEGFYAEIKDDRVVIKRIESKVKVGDWVILNGTVAQILDKQKYGFVGIDIDGKDFFCNYGHTDSMRLWTIEDAKDGDVLAINWHKNDNSWEKIIIFKKYHNKGVKGLYNAPCVEGYGNTFKNGKLAFQEEVPYYSETWTANLHPATKEQHDLLFQTMKKENYKWDAEKKELKKICEIKPLDANKVIEWLNDQACLGWIEDVEVDKFINKFKQDFGL